jgi:protein O-GlcNAc transferase
MTLADAAQALERGNLQKADILVRAALDQDPDDATARSLLARIAAQAGVDAMGRYPDARPRHLLIKAWGAGFWSDLDHVLGALLLADMTGRIPLVRWGVNSRYRDPDDDDAFANFFAPVSAARFGDLATARSFFPAKWHRDNLAAEDVAKWRGPGSRAGALHLLGRTEDVVVSDFHVGVADLLPWIARGHRLHGLPLTAIYRRLVTERLRLTDPLARAIDAHWTRCMAGRPWLAVHVRGTDKIREAPALAQVNRDYDAIIAQILRADEGLGIFLLTDQLSVLAAFRQRWGDRVVANDVRRADGTVGVHLDGAASSALGRQIVLDCWIAARCDIFLGNGMSNVSTGIRHLKDWPENRFFLMTPDALARRNPFLHDW